MKRVFALYTALLMFLVIALAGCNDPNAVTDQNIEIVNNNWSYINKIKCTVKIDDDGIPYNLYLNLRVTADYKYSNIFVLIRQAASGKRAIATRYEVKLANTDGEWLGEGSGNIYSYQVPFKTNYKFPAKGIYYFEIEQNMRDNPLHEVSDVGMRVEKVAP